MKRFLALLLALIFALSLCACGGDDEPAEASTPVPSSSDAPTADAPTEEPAEETPEAPASGYLTYDDLENTMSFILWRDEGNLRFQCDYPTGFHFESHSNGMGSENSLAFSIVLAHGEDTMPGASLEEAFLTLLNGDDGFHSLLRQVNRASYDEVTPDEMEYVTLDCGREAIRFSGIQHVDDYGTLYDSYLHGYFTLIDDIPVIVGYIIFDEEELEADRLAERDRYYSTDEMEHYVVEIINTLRVVEW